MCDKAIKLLTLVFLHSFLLPINIRVKKINDGVPSENPFMLKYYLDRYKTLKM